MVFGALQGSVVVCHHPTDEVEHRFDAEISNPAAMGGEDAILGLCWLRQDRNKFIAGSSSGVLSCCSVGEAPGVVAQYPEFKQLTSVHVNSDDSLLVTCGYQNGVRLYDLETSKVLQVTSFSESFFGQGVETRHCAARIALCPLHPNFCALCLTPFRSLR